MTETIAAREGRPPRGWLGAGAYETPSTPDLLKELGYRYLMDWPMDDQPVWLRTRAGPEQLVTRGFYRYVRHPIYTFSFLLIWLIPVVTWNILALMIGLTIYTFIGTLLEERKLREEFGAVYDEYRRETPMVFPKIRVERSTK